MALLMMVSAAMVSPLKMSPAAAAQDDAGTLIRLINAERNRAGRPQLRVHPEATAYARRHSQDMAASDSIWHTKNLLRVVSVGTVVGENVGEGAPIESIHAMFMDSPKHRSNALDRDYSLVGVGVVVRDDWLFVTVIFAGYGSRGFGSPGESTGILADFGSRAESTLKLTNAPQPVRTVDDSRLVAAQHQMSILRQLISLDDSPFGATGAEFDSFAPPQLLAWFDRQEGSAAGARLVA